MTSDSPIPDPYEAVLMDLRAKRDQIDQTIQMLEGMRSGGFPSGSFPMGATVTPASPRGKPQEAAEGPGAFLGMSIHEAAKKLLTMRKRAMGNAEIAEALKAGGLVMNTNEPLNLIGSVLTRRFNQVGDIVKVGRGIWGLKEWYPNRSFGRKGEGAKASGSNAPEQPSEQPSSDVLG